MKAGIIGKISNPLWVDPDKKTPTKLRKLLSGGGGYNPNNPDNPDEDKTPLNRVLGAKTFIATKGLVVVASKKKGPSPYDAPLRITGPSEYENETTASLPVSTPAPRQSPPTMRPPSERAQSNIGSPGNLPVANAAPSSDPELESKVDPDIAAAGAIVDLHADPEEIAQLEANLGIGSSRPNPALSGASLRPVTSPLQHQAASSNRPFRHASARNTPSGTPFPRPRTLSQEQSRHTTPFGDVLPSPALTHSQETAEQFLEHLDSQRATGTPRPPSRQQSHRLSAERTPGPGTPRPPSRQQSPLLSAEEARKKQKMETELAELAIRKAEMELKKEQMAKERRLLTERREQALRREQQAAAAQDPRRYAAAAQDPRRYAAAAQDPRRYAAAAQDPRRYAAAQDPRRYAAASPSTAGDDEGQRDVRAHLAQIEQARRKREAAAQAHQRHQGSMGAQPYNDDDDEDDYDANETPRVTRKEFGISGPPWAATPPAFHGTPERNFGSAMDYSRPRTPLDTFSAAFGEPRLGSSPAQYRRPRASSLLGTSSLSGTPLSSGASSLQGSEAVNDLLASSPYPQRQTSHVNRDPRDPRFNSDFPLFGR